MPFLIVNLVKFLVYMIPGANHVIYKVPVRKGPKAFGVHVSQEPRLQELIQKLKELGNRKSREKGRKIPNVK